VETLDTRVLDTVDAWQKAKYSVTIYLKNETVSFWVNSEYAASRIRQLVRQMPFLIETHRKTIKVDSASFVSLDFSPLRLPS
jgi:hypothetical protein